MARHTLRTATRSLERVVRYWRLFADGDQALSCELCRTDEALELRCGTDTERPVRTARIDHATGALALAEQWRTEYLRNETRYHEAPSDDTSTPSRPRTVFELRARRGSHPDRS